MRPIIILGLALQAGVVLATAYLVMFGRPSLRNARPAIWPSLAISLMVLGWTSWNIGERQAEQPGAELLQFGGPVMFGMGLIALFVTIRQLFGRDAAP
jgi:hypothetical protein